MRQKRRITDRPDAAGSKNKLRRLHGPPGTIPGLQRNPPAPQHLHAARRRRLPLRAAHHAEQSVHGRVSMPKLRPMVQYIRTRTAAPRRLGRITNNPDIRAKRSGAGVIFLESSIKNNYPIESINRITNQRHICTITHRICSSRSTHAMHNKFITRL